MAKNELNISLTSYDDIFKSEANSGSDEITQIPLSELKPFEEQPFKVHLDESMDELVESVREYGVLSPIIARPHPDGGYEILSGHRRAKACELAGITDVPVMIKDLDDDSATILLVDSNLQRENILPSEKAHAYRLKLEAMKRKAGRPPKENASQIATNFEKGRSDEKMAEEVGESKDQIRRYIRLTELIDPLMEMVDNKEIAMNAAVELSYLSAKQQAEVVTAIEQEETAPSIAQAKKIHKFASEGKLNDGVVEAIMQEQKPEKLSVTIKEDKLRKYFPKSYDAKKIEETILKLVEKWARQRSEQER